MNYREFTDELTGDKHIIIETAPDEYKSFPADESNPEFVAFLETADGKAYLEAQVK